MMFKTVPSAAILIILALSLAPQALVCGTVEKHRCSCCDQGDDCACCTIAPLYPDQAAASIEAPRVHSPEAWAPVPDRYFQPENDSISILFAVETVHGPPPLLQTTQLRI